MPTETITGLENDQEYGFRIYPRNLQSQYQTEPDGATVSAMPQEGVPLSQLAEGAAVMISESGVLTAFYLAKHDYEVELNGSGFELLVRKNCLPARQWNSERKSTLVGSTLDAFFNQDYKNSFPSALQGEILTTIFRYTIGGGNNMVSTLSRCIFSLSMKELDKTHVSVNVEGSALPIASMLQQATGDNGQGIKQFTRSASISSTGDVWVLYETGAISGELATSSFGVRPAFALPAAARVAPTPNADGSYNLVI